LQTIWKHWVGHTILLIHFRSLPQQLQAHGHRNYWPSYASNSLRVVRGGCVVTTVRQSAQAPATGLTLRFIRAHCSRSTLAAKIETDGECGERWSLSNGKVLLQRGSWLSVAGYADQAARRAIPVGFDPPYALPRPRWAPTAQAKKPIGRELLHIMPRPLPGYHADSINEHIL